MCTTNTVEDESDFLIRCPKYESKRNKLFEDIFKVYHKISGLSDDDKLYGFLYNHKLSKSE